MELFHPIIQQWFSERYGIPTDIQAMAWPRIAAREHLLITAPTGSGKTLTAFLWTLNRFITGDLEAGKTRIVYISPLKALNNDIRKNLMEPLAALKARFEAASLPFPTINVATRSGDTDAQQRRLPSGCHIPSFAQRRWSVNRFRSNHGSADLECPSGYSLSPPQYG